MSTVSDGVLSPSPQEESPPSAKTTSVFARQDIDLPDISVVVEQSTTEMTRKKRETETHHAEQGTTQDEWNDPTLFGGNFKSETRICAMAPAMTITRSETNRAPVSVDPDVFLRDPSYRPPPQPESPESRVYEFIDPNRKDTGPVTDGKEALLKIEKREKEKKAAIADAIKRSEKAKKEEELARMATARRKQYEEIERYRSQQAEIRKALASVMTDVEKVMRDIADAFLAISICPDHVEFLKGTNTISDPWMYVTWQGQVYTYQQLIDMTDGEVQYTAGPKMGTSPPVFYSARECRWGINQAIPSKVDPILVERVLPVVRQHADGTVRFSATQAGLVKMMDGLIRVYVADNRVFTRSHYLAAKQIGLQGKLSGIIANGAEKMESALKATTRFFRKPQKP